MTTIREAFNSKAEAWLVYTQTAPGRLREELNWRYLYPHLPAAPAHILDVGSGTGGLALRLAQQGYYVHLLDLSDEMLAIARRHVQTHSFAEKVSFSCAAVEDWQPNTQFDVVVCHTLLEYVSDVAGILGRLVAWLRDGGILSVTFVNQYAESLTLALSKGNLGAAISSLESSSSAADLFGVPRQLFTSQQIQEMMTSLSVAHVADYGVRVIADYLLSVEWKEDAALFDEVVRLESVLAGRFPYCHIGRYGQVIYRKESMPT